MSKNIKANVMDIEYDPEVSYTINKVWGVETYVEERTVDVHITRLRKALSRSNNTKFESIKTIRCVGYILKS